MASLVFLIVLSLLAVVVTVVWVGRLRFERRLAKEMRALLVAPHRLRPANVSGLPPPVERYRQLAVGTRAPVHTLRLQHAEPSA
jgi:hypothetical protein